MSANRRTNGLHIAVATWVPMQILTLSGTLSGNPLTVYSLSLYRRAHAHSFRTRISEALERAPLLLAVGIVEVSVVSSGLCPRAVALLSRAKYPKRPFPRCAYHRDTKTLIWRPLQW